MKKSLSTVLFFFLILTFPFISQVQAESSVKDCVRDYKKGLTLYSQGHYEQALNCFEQAIDKKFTFWQSYQMVGYCYYELREKADALDAFEQSLEINPNNPKLIKIYNKLKSGDLDVPVRPVDDTAMAKRF
jgi:tetratricopeptide (TPR) repeat protein